MQAMIMANPQTAYRKQGVLTASPVELIVMLYDGLKKNIVLGRRAIAKSDIPGAHKYLVKAQDIVGELVSSLDMRVSISAELLDIYEYIILSLEYANVHKDSSATDVVLEIVDSLREAWQEISRAARGELHLSEEQA